MDYPDHNHCGIFDGRNSSKAQIESTKMPGELCTIDEEVALLKNLGTCATDAQVRRASSYVLKSTTLNTLPDGFPNKPDDSSG